MKTIDLEKFKRARVWLNELPACEYVPSMVLTHVVAASHAGDPTIHCAAIELLVPLGARSMYALIGGEYSSNNSNTLEIELAIADDGPSFADSLASPSDVVKIGLPNEFVRGVIEGINIGCSELDWVCAGKLRIACSAHGVMWSSEAIFSKVASILVKLINIGRPDMTDSAIARLFSAQ
jgi:hypothetical protein